MEQVKHKVGRVLLGKFDGCQKFEIRWRDRKTGKYVRTRLDYTKFSDAKAHAEALNVRLIGNGGSLEEAGKPAAAERPRSQEVDHTVSQAALEAIRSSDANDICRVQYTRLYNTFAAYLEKHQPGVALWRDVTERVVQEYHEHCRGLARSWDTVRQRLMILRLTARHMTRTYPGRYRVVTDAVRLKRRGPPASELGLADAILKPKQLRAFLGWLAPRDPMLHAFACMGGLCGMRGREYHYLRERDVDFERRTVTVTENEAHSPKTRASYRTIPVCGAALGSLRRWMDGHWQRRPGDDFLFPAPKNPIGGKPAKFRHALAGCFATETVSKRFRAAIDAARADGVDLAPKFTACKLRHTFITAMRGLRADYPDIQTYVGQTVGTVLTVHYDHASLERLRRIADLAQTLACADEHPSTTEA